VGQVLHKPTWRLVSRFLALTPFMADVLRKSGLPGDRVSIRPSWVPDAGPITAQGTELLFVGRLDEAKGVRLLLEAWRRGGSASGRLLRIAGDGPLRAEVEAAAAAFPESVQFEGWVNSTRVTELMDRSAAVVIPSLCFEGYPLVVAQAFSRGRGVLAVTGGSAGSIVATSAGWTAAPEAADLARVMERISASEVEQQGAAARRRYVVENSPEAGLKSLLDAYGHVIAERRAAR
jgi:glycosyltransferase involved in cell wall biosynthesis